MPSRIAADGSRRALRRSMHIARQPRRVARLLSRGLLRRPAKCRTAQAFARWYATVERQVVNSARRDIAPSSVRGPQKPAGDPRERRAPGFQPGGPHGSQPARLPPKRERSERPLAPPPRQVRLWQGRRSTPREGTPRRSRTVRPLERGRFEPGRHCRRSIGLQTACPSDPRGPPSEPCCGPAPA